MTKLQPELRFKEFSGKIEKKVLGKFIKLTSGYAFKSEFFSETGQKLVIPKNFTKNGYANFNDKNTKFTTEIVDKKYICNPNDLLVLLTDLTSSCELLGKPLELKESDGITLLNQRIVKIEPLNQEIIDKRFIKYFFLTDAYHDVIKSTASGTTVRHSSNKIIKNIKIPVLLLPEQKKIASFLSSMDEKIQKLEGKKEKLEEYKKGIMQKIFSQEIRFKDDRGESFPDWEEKKLGEVCKKKSSNISANTLEEDFGKYPIYGASGYIKSISNYQEEIQYIAIVKDGAGVGRLQFCSSFTSVLGTLDKILSNKDSNILYLYYLIEQKIQFKKYIVGSTIPHIYFKDYSLEKINFPCFEEQEKIAEFLSSVDEKIEKVKGEIDKMKEFKKGLLQKMFV